jgi:hypothetical protein
MFETPKQTEKFVFWFREKKPKKQIEFAWVLLGSKIENIFCLFRGHTSYYHSKKILVCFFQWEFAEWARSPGRPV